MEPVQVRPQQKQMDDIEDKGTQTSSLTDKQLQYLVSITCWHSVLSMRELIRWKIAQFQCLFALLKLYFEFESLESIVTLHLESTAFIIVIYSYKRLVSRLVQWFFGLLVKMDLDLHHIQPEKVQEGDRTTLINLIELCYQIARIIVKNNNISIQEPTFTSSGLFTVLFLIL